MNFQFDHNNFHQNLIYLLWDKIFFKTLLKREKKNMKNHLKVTFGIIPLKFFREPNTDDVYLDKVSFSK